MSQMTIFLRRLSPVSHLLGAATARPRHSAELRLKDYGLGSLSSASGCHGGSPGDIIHLAFPPSDITPHYSDY